MTDTLSDLDFPDWLPQYKAALLELDRTRLRERVSSARRAISERMKVLAQDHDGTPAERQAITDALSGLVMLERELAIEQEKTNRSEPKALTGTENP